MKGRICTLGIAAALLLTACSKDNENLESNEPQRTGLTATGTRSSGTVSGWESGIQWNLADSSNYIIYLHTRSFSEITSDLINTGAVVVWIRNYKTEQGTVMEKPMQTPFAVLPPLGRPAYNNYWYHTLAPGSVTVKFRSNKHQYTNEPIPLPDASTQVRFFVIPKSDLDAWGHTPLSVSRLSYAQLTQLAGVSE